MDLSNFTVFLTMDGVDIKPENEKENQQAHGENNNVSAETGVPSNNAGAANQEAPGGFMGIGGIAIYIVGLIALFYFFAIRPQKKKEKELMNIQNAIQVGDWVMTSSGFYGRVADIADQVFVVEFGTNKGVKIPVRKSEIIGNKEPNLTVSPSSSDEKDK